MKVKSLALAVLCILLSSCGIGGYWMNGNPFPHKNNRPPLDKWEKASTNTTPEQRFQVARECGSEGESYGSSPSFYSEKVAAERKPSDKNDFAPRGRLYDEWERCLLKKGYRYIGEKCSKNNKITRASPACGAP